MAAGDATERLLEELVTWTKFGYRSQFVAALKDALKDARHYRAYEASDGGRNQGEVAEIADMSQQSVSSLWAKWRRLGLVSISGARAKHLMKPSDLGLEPPQDAPRGRGSNATAQQSDSGS